RSVCGSYPRPVRPLLGPGSGAEPVRVGGAHGGTAQRVAAADGVGRRPDRPARTGPGSRTAAQSHTHDPGRTRALLPRPPGGRPVPADRRCRDCVPATQVPPGCCLSVPPGPSGRDTPPQQTTTGAPMTQRVYYDDGTPRGPGGTPGTSTSTTPAPKSPTATPSAASTGSPASPPAEPSEDTSPTPTGTGSPTRPCPSTSSPPKALRRRETSSVGGLHPGPLWRRGSDGAGRPVLPGGHGNGRGETPAGAAGVRGHRPARR